MTEQTEIEIPNEPQPVIEADAKPVKQVQKTPTSIAVKEGAIAPTNHSELVRTIENIAAGGGFPAIFDTPQKRMASYSLAQSLMGTRWQLALNNIAIIKGKMCIWGELPGALAEQTKEVKERDVYIIDENMDKICVANKNLKSPPFAGVCIIQRKGRSKKEFTYTIDEATAAGQYPAMKWDKDLKKQVPNTDSPWMKWPKVMLMRKAMAMAINFEFPDAKAGTPIAEYEFDAAPDLIDVGPGVSSQEPTGDRSKDLNSRFKTVEETDADSVSDEA